VIQNLKKRAQQLGYELVETMGVNKKFIVTQIQ